MECAAVPTARAPYKSSFITAVVSLVGGNSAIDCLWKVISKMSTLAIFTVHFHYIITPLRLLYPLLLHAGRHIYSGAARHPNPRQLPVQ